MWQPAVGDLPVHALLSRRASARVMAAQPERPRSLGPFASITQPDVAYNLGAGAVSSLKPDDFVC